MADNRATARAHANIAVAKYWGKRNAALNLPFVDSVAFNVDALTTETTAAWVSQGEQDTLTINDCPVPPHRMTRMVRILDEIRRLRGWSKRCVLRSHNTFPYASGLASSASGSAACALAAATAAGLDLTQKQLSCLARLGSGSAARSIPPGWTRWYAGQTDDGSDSYAVSIAQPEHWPLHVFVVQVSNTPKTVSSSDGMRLSQSSPFWKAYLEAASHAADHAQNVILNRDFRALTEIMHESAMQLHALTMSCKPPLCYFAPQSIEVLQYALRQCQSVPVCCTLDAGANVVVLCEASAASLVKNDITAMGLPFIQTRIGEGTIII